MNITIKPCLISLLKERGMTQTQLSEMSGVPQGSISRFDKNDRHVDWHVFAIARVLEVTIEELFNVEVD
jgi:DNA-binding XRE family transcriptional regulator